MDCGLLTHTETSCSCVRYRQVKYDFTGHENAHLYQTLTVKCGTYVERCSWTVILLKDRELKSSAASIYSEENITVSLKFKS